MPPKQTLWSDTSSIVGQSFRLNKAIAHKIPSSITFTEDDRKIFFLGGCGRSTLFSVDLDQAVASPDMPLDHTQFFDNSYVPTSREEELLRERQRISKVGITGFEYSGKTLLVPLGSKLYYHDMSSTANQPQIIRESEDNVFFDAKLCPTDSRVISFIKGGDIFITAGHVQEYVQLTTSNGTPGLQCGVPCYAIQEEFDRYTGYYWRPCQPGGPDSHQLLYEEVDERAVPTMRLYTQSEEETWRFPFTGQTNARSTLRIVRANLSTENRSVERCRLKRELDTIYPWVEYIPWFGWHPSGESVWCVLLNRAQQKLLVLSIALSFFVPENEPAPENGPDSDELPAELTVIVERESSTWIDVDLFGAARFLPGPSLDLVFGYEDQYTHLYRARPGKPEVRLTDGDWSVTSIVKITPTTVFFHAVMNPLEQHLYRVDFERPCQVTQLSVDGFFHICEVNNSNSEFVSVFSNVKTHYQAALFSVADGSKLKTITHSLDFTEVYLQRHIGVEGEDQGPVAGAAGGGVSVYRYDPPLLGKVRVGENHIYYMMYPAKNVDLTKPQPVVLYVYGGPSIQLVVDRFKGIHHRQQNLLATLGYTVVIADCPGSANRGKAWAECLYKKMGTVEVDMQVNTLKELSKLYPYLDLTKVAVMGTSYGGYVSLMALSQRPDFFTLGIAIAPAVSWKLYDTAYSERFMGLLPEAEAEYRESSVLTYANTFPDEEHRLLIIHGLIDENVHFNHTVQLISELIDEGKPYDLQVYPSERHGIVRGNSPSHCDTTIAVYLHNHLKTRSTLEPRD